MKIVYAVRSHSEIVYKTVHTNIIGGEKNHFQIEAAALPK